MHFHLESKIDQDVAVIIVHGDLDLYTTPQLRTALLELLEDDFCEFVIDMNDAGFFDSAATGVLLGLENKLSSRDGWLRIVSGSELINKMLILTGAFKLFPIYRSISDAISYDRPGRPMRKDVPEDEDAIRRWVGKDAIRAQTAIRQELNRPAGERRNALLLELAAMVAEVYGPWIPMRVYLDSEEGHGKSNRPSRMYSRHLDSKLYMNCPP